MGQLHVCSHGEDRRRWLKGDKMWDYIFLVIDLIEIPGTETERDEEMERRVIALGKEGWEMVNFVQNKNSDLEFLYWFKRWKVID